MSFPMGSMLLSGRGVEWFTLLVLARSAQKTPDAWFFLAYDMTESAKGKAKFNQALVGVVIVFTWPSPCLLGWWSGIDAS